MAARVIAITGASGALGSAVALAAAAKGARLALIDHGARADQGLPGADAVFSLEGVDLADAAQAEAAMRAVAERLDGLDGLINVAGGFVSETLEDGEPETWRRMFRLNLETAANASRAAIPFLKQSSAGRIVNVGANAALRPGKGMGAYAAAKAGVHSLTLALADELKSAGVSVNAVLPSILDTPANRADMPKADVSAWVAPADLAAVMLFLASPEARAITGALIPVTGKG